MQQIITLCDVCGDGATTGEPVVVTLGERSAAKVVDLCAVHESELVGPLSTVLGEHGRRLAASTASVAPKATSAAVDELSGEPFPCIYCPHTVRTSGGLEYHLRETHGLRNPTAAYGDPRCPLCGEEKASMTGLGAHARSHGVGKGDGVHALYRAALAEDDPHGLIAERRAALDPALSVAA